MTGMQVWAKTEPKQLDILFTHDTHSHLNSFTTIVNGEKKEAGGFAKLKTLIDEHKKVNSDTCTGWWRFFNGNTGSDGI